jgi:hypothetical protein
MFSPRIVVLTKHWTNSSTVGGELPTAGPIPLIGNSWASHSVAQLRAVFNFADFDSIDFHVINRNLPRELLSEPNVTLHEAAGVEDMLRVVMQSHYVAAPTGGVFDENRLSVQHRYPPHYKHAVRFGTSTGSRGAGRLKEGHSCVRACCARREGTARRAPGRGKVRRMCLTCGQRLTGPMQTGAREGVVCDEAYSGPDALAAASNLAQAHGGDGRYADAELINMGCLVSRAAYSATSIRPRC